MHYYRQKQPKQIRQRFLDLTGHCIWPERQSARQSLWYSYCIIQVNTKRFFTSPLFRALSACCLFFFLKEKKKAASTMEKGNFFSFFKYWKIASKEYKHLVTGLLLFALFNSSDVFLLLKTKETIG